MKITPEIMTLKSVAEILGYKNRRSAIRWCLNNGVEIHNYHGSKRRFVLMKQFEWVRYQKFFSRAVKKNPELEK